MAGAFCLLMLSAIAVTANSEDLSFVRDYDYSHTRSPVIFLEDLWDLERTETLSASQRFVLDVDVSESLHITPPHYLSVNLDAFEIKHRFRGFDFSSKRLRSMAAALSPAHLRFGGTYADFLHFDPDGVDDSALMKLDDAHVVDTSTYPAFADSKTLKYATLTGARWDNITRFCEDVGWDLMWDFNLFVWKGGLWDPSEARKFLEYSADRGVKIPSFQLGNEPNSFKFNFNFSLEPAVLVQGFQTLKDLISEFPQYAASNLYGPESTNLDVHASSRKFLISFLQAGGCDVVTEIGLHHYYLDGTTATVKEFMAPNIMDKLKLQMEYARNITWENCRVHKPIRFTETSSAFGGGANGISNAYVAGFLWLDKLGLAAKLKVTHLFRQTFFGAFYALVDPNLYPNPDFFLSVLYKRLVEGPVFDVISTHIPSQLRLYAHCARQAYYKYPDGALVIYYLYMGTEAASLDLGRYQSSAGVHLFALTPGDGDGMNSRKVKLNGILLELKDNELPSMNPKLHLGDVPMPQQSFGFIVIPDAEVRLCKIYHNSRTT